MDSGTAQASRAQLSAADGPGRGRALEHGLGNKVVGKGPSLACGGGEAVAKDGRERGEEGGAKGLVVGGPYPVGNVPGSKGSGVDEKLVVAGLGLDDLSELFGEPDLLLAATADPSRSASWTRSASPPGAGYLILRTSPIRGAAVLPA